MATIRFTANERPRLLAKAVLEVETLDELDKLRDLASAFARGAGKDFDALLVAEFGPLALFALEAKPLDEPTTSAADGQAEADGEA